MDGRTDLYVTSAGYNVATDSWDALLWNDGDGTFTEGAVRAGMNGKAWHSAAVVGDVNGDGRPDLFVSSYTDPNFVVDPASGFPSTAPRPRSPLPERRHRRGRAFDVSRGRPARSGQNQGRARPRSGLHGLQPRRASRPVCRERRGSQSALRERRAEGWRRCRSRAPQRPAPTPPLPAAVVPCDATGRAAAAARAAPITGSSGNEFVPAAPPLPIGPMLPPAPPMSRGRAVTTGAGRCLSVHHRLRRGRPVWLTEQLNRRPAADAHNRVRRSNRIRARLSPARAPDDRPAALCVGPRHFRSSHSSLSAPLGGRRSSTRGEIGDKLKIGPSANTVRVQLREERTLTWLRLYSRATTKRSAH